MAARKRTVKKYTYAAGRRRSSTARVRLFKGKGESLVNDLPAKEYFPGKINDTRWSLPFGLTDTQGKYYVTIKVTGGGKQGQMDACLNGIAKAFNVLDSDKYRQPLKKAGLLTRDSRIRERRKVGTGGKARRAKQSPKR